ncbi:MAG: hypothetical protein IKN79_08770, partial [Eubacterium sp.]|nr:hypothetical protein [Eubacterium sp.]
PAYAAAPQDDANLKEQLRTAVSDEEYPNGLFGFYKTQLTVDEGGKTSILVCRQGNTDTEATVHFKAIDISAKYGDDYLLTVNHSTLKKEQLRADEDAGTLMEQGVYSGEPNNTDEIIIEDTEEKVSAEQADSDAQDEDQSVSENTSEEQESEEEPTAKKSGLALAYEAQRGESAPENDWTETNPESAPEDIANAMDAGTDQTIGYFESAQGVETLLTFKTGEYQKEIVFDSLDDEKSESDEQIVFAIYGAEGADIGKDYNGYVNIKDNDEAEAMTYAMQDKQVVVTADEDKAIVTVTRTTGTDQIGFATVGTKAVTAVANEDYEAGTQEIIFAPGETQKQVEIPIKGSRETDKTFYVGISKEGVVRDEENAATLVTIAAKNSVLLEGTAEDGSIVSMGTVTYTPNKDGWVLGPVDMRLADKITVYYNTWGETTEEDCDETYYYNGKCVRVRVTTQSEVNVLSSDRNHSGYNVNDSMSWSRNLNSNISSWSSLDRGWIHVSAWGTGKNSRASIKCTKVEINYPTFNFTINNDSDKVYYKEVQYSGNTSKATKSELKLGTACFDNDRNKATKAVSAGQSLGLTNNFSGQKNSQGIACDSNTVKFEGYALQQKGKSNVWSKVVNEVTGAIDYNFISKYAKDYMYDNNTFNLTPVYTVKDANVKFNNSNSKKVSYKGYKNGSTVKAKKLDTFAISAAGSTGYSVSNIRISGGGYNNSNKNNGQADKSNFSTGLGGSASDYSVDLDFENAKLKVMPDPVFKNTKDIKNGVVLYIDPKTKTVYSAAMDKKYTNNKNQQEFTIPDVTMNTTYNIIGTAVEGYSPVWRDGTLDNDEKGQVIPASMNGYTSFTPVRGSVLPYTTKLAIGRVYYSFEKSTAASSPTDIYGYVVLRDRMLLTGTLVETGLNGANVSANGNAPVVSSYGGPSKRWYNDGYFQISDKSFSATQYYLVNCSYNGDEGSVNTSFVINPAVLGDCIVDTAADLEVNNVKVFTCKPEKDGKYKDENYVQQKITIDEETGMYYGLNNGDSKIKLEMHADKTGMIINSAELQFYDKDGKRVNLKDGKKVTGVKIGDKDSGNFKFEFIPRELELKPGTTVRVTFTDSQGHTYLQRQTGISLTEALGPLDIANSFAFGGTGSVIQMVGQINSNFNLGWNDDFDKSDAVVTNELGDKTITVGFNKEALKKSDNRSNIKKAADKLAAKDQAIADVNKEIAPLAKKKSLNASEKKKLQELNKKADEAIKAKKEEQKKYDETVGDMQNPNKTHTNVGGGATLNVGFSFAMTFGLDKTTNQYYFKEMILTATISGGAEVTVSFATPIGVTIYLGFAAGGEGSASFIVEERKDQKHPIKYYISQMKDGESGEVNIFDCDMNNANRKFDAYGSFNLKPYISISVGAGIAGDLIKVEVKGTAQFDMTFYTNEKEDCGTVNLSAELTVKVLIISHTWQLASTSINLFGNSGATALGTEGTNYLYDSADVLKPQDMSYMEGGTKWNTGMISAKSIDESENGFVEAPVTKNAIAEDPGFKIADLGNGKYAGVFLNVDPSRTIGTGEDAKIDSLNSKAAYLTIYDGTKWSEPVLIEDDGTLDQDVDIFELGSRGAVITWSSADKKFTDATMKTDMQNSLNLHCAFVDSNGARDTVIHKVTKTTDAGDYSDVCADVIANVSYNEDGLVFYYQKKEYEPTYKDQEYLGDVLFPDTTVMAARFYTFDSASGTTGAWKDKYTPDEMTELGKEGYNPTLYQTGFYGQDFFDFLPSIKVQETLDEEGYWAKNEGGTVIEPKVLTLREKDKNKALIIDTDAMSYNDLGVFAYTVDMDGDLKTLDDRDIYMQ